MTVTSMPQAAETAAPAEEPKGGGKKKLIILLVLLAVLGGAGYWFFLKPSGEPAPPEKGAVVMLEPIQVNLSGAHYLRLGMALQLTADAGEEVNGSEALDAAIDLFSGLDIAVVGDAKKRRELKKALVKELDKLYDGAIMDIYFTEFVTQ